jgi:predicted membrane metal-binding protein
MLFVLIFFALLSPVIPDFTPYIQTIAQPFQKICLDRVQTLRLPRLTEAIVCGSSEMNPSDRKDFLKIGIYHVLVVSGAHFLVLSQLFGGAPIVFRGLVLTLFLLLSGASPPAIRALIHLAINFVAAVLRLHWNWIDRLIFSTAVVLCLFCSLLSTKSLFLSVVCATIFSFPSAREANVNFQKIFLSSLLAGAVMAANSITHPIGWFTGAVLSPCIGLILFPLLLLSWILPDLNSLISGITDGMLRGVSKLSAIVPENTAPNGTAMPQGLSWALLLVGLVLLKHWTQEKAARPGQEL